MMNPIRTLTVLPFLAVLAAVPAPAQTSLHYPLVFDNTLAYRGDAWVNASRTGLNVLARFHFSPKTVGIYGPAARGQTGALLATLRYSTSQRAYRGGLPLTAQTRQAVLDGLTYVQASNASFTTRAQIDIVPGTRGQNGFGPILKVSGSATPGGTLSFHTGAPLVVVGLAMGPGITQPLGRPIACLHSIPIGVDIRGPLFFVRKVDLPRAFPGPYHFAVQAFEIGTGCLSDSQSAYRIAVQ